MVTRLNQKIDKEAKEKEFHKKINTRLQEWNYTMNRIQEEQLNRLEANRFGNRFEDRLCLYGSKVEEKPRVEKEILRDPNTNAKEETVTLPPSRPRSVCERIRRLRENNAKVLGITEEQLQTEKDETQDDIPETEYNNLLLS